MLADEVDYVIGVDTHRDQHTIAVVVAPTGGVVAQQSVCADGRRQALVQLRSVIVTAPDSLRQELRQLPAGQLIRRCSHFRRSGTRTPDQLAIVLVLRTLARRIEAATAEASELEHEIRKHINA